MGKRTEPGVDTMERALLAILGTTKWTQVALARRFHVSEKTLARWLSGHAFPPPTMRHGLVHALADLEPSLLTRFSMSLGLGSEIAAQVAPPGKVAPIAARDAIEMAVLDAADDVNAAPGRTRQAIATFLDRLAAAGVERDAARTLLAVPRGGKKRAP